MSELKALLFDVDGTLADTERDGHRVAFNRAFSDAGLDWHWSVEEYGWLLQVTGGKERMHFFIQQRNPPLPEGVDIDQMIVELHAENPAFEPIVPTKTSDVRILGQVVEVRRKLAEDPASRRAAELLAALDRAGPRAARRGGASPLSRSCTRST